MNMRAAIALAIALTTASVAAQGQETLFIAPTGDGFDVYLAAAMHKKKVPLTVVTNQESATYTLTASVPEEQQESTGSKVVRCLFAYCAGIEDKARAAVQLSDASGAVVWSYAVNKGRGSKNRQSMAEAIAKHLKSAYRPPLRR